VTIRKLREPTKGKQLDLPHFPTKYQAVIFRLWEMIPCEKIARVIEAEEEQVRMAAKDMGLGEQKNTQEWQIRGYISILKAVWNLLPYEQIFILLDWDEERLAYVLKEDDFLGTKLGEKCDCEFVRYRALNREEEIATARIRYTMENSIRPMDGEATAIPFDFFHNQYKPLAERKARQVQVNSAWSLELPENNDAIKDFVEDFRVFAARYGVHFAECGKQKLLIKMDVETEDEEYREIEITDDCILIHVGAPLGVLRAFYDLEELVESVGSFSFEKKHYRKKTKIKTRFIYSFCGLYGDVLDKDTEISFPNELLEGYGRRGVNGIWIQGVLYKLAPYPFDEKLASGWEERLCRLEELTHRASRYGIKVYMYINEPRNMPLAFFEKYPHLKGATLQQGVACLCSSHAETKQYLRDALQTVCKRVPLLGGFFNITQSENTVLCCSRGMRVSEENQCPVCSKRGGTVVTAEIITCMAEAVAEVNPNMKLFAFAWGWESHLGKKGTEELVRLLPQNVIVLQVSESNIDFVRGGKRGFVRDYSIFIVGPGDAAKRLWTHARKQGLEVAAKIQINNSWECSSAPFLPIYDNVVQHMKNLIEEGVEHIMLSWTLGGYMSDSIKIAASYFFEEDIQGKDAYEEVLSSTYGSYAERVKRAVGYFCKGAEEYPFHVCHIYRGPSNAGTANLLYPEPSGMRATMTCYPYDDVKGWCADYSGDEQGGSPYTPEVLELQYGKLCEQWEKGLEILEGMPVCEFYDMALYGYTLFKSSYNQICYYRYRDSNKNQEKMREIVQSEKELALLAYQIMLRNSAVGYEAANHYYVTRSMLAEKVVECEYLLK